MPDLPDPNEAESRTPVQEADRAVREEKASVKQLRSQLEEKREQIQERKEELSEVKADARIGDATESDVDTVRQDLISLEEEAQALSAEIETSERAIEKLKGKKAQRVNQERASIEKSLRETYNARLKSAIEKMEAAQEAVEEAAAAGTRLSSQTMMSVASVNGNPTVVPGGLDHEEMQVGVLTNRNEVRYTVEQLKDQAREHNVIGPGA